LFCRNQTLGKAVQLMHRMAIQW